MNGVFDDDETRPVSSVRPPKSEPNSSATPGIDKRSHESVPARASDLQGPPRFDAFDDDMTIMVDTPRHGKAADSTVLRGVPPTPPQSLAGQPWLPPKRPNAPDIAADTSSQGVPLKLIGLVLVLMAVATFALVIFLSGGLGETI